MAEVFGALLGIVIGYLAGSVLPADLLARRQGVDIREIGDGNPGTANAFKGLGWRSGVVTGTYDALVGVVSILIASVLGASEGGAYLAGLAALAGHRFPVYDRFRCGGQGMAASAGMIVYGMGVALTRGWLSLAEVAVLVGIAIVTLLVSSDRAIAIVTLPILVLMLAAGGAAWQYLAFMAVVATNVWVVQLFEIRHGRGSLAVRPLRH